MKIMDYYPETAASRFTPVTASLNQSIPSNKVKQQNVSRAVYSLPDLHNFLVGRFMTFIWKLIITKYVNALTFKN